MLNGRVCVPHHFSFLCCVISMLSYFYLLCFCLLPLFCVSNVTSVSGLSSSCVLCIQCCQCLWFVFFLCLMYPMLPVSLVCLLPVSYVSNVTSVSGLSSSCVLCIQCYQCLWFVFWSSWLLLSVFSNVYCFYSRIQNTDLLRCLRIEINNADSFTAIFGK